MAAQDDEIYFKAALDISDVKPIIQDLSKQWDKHNQDIAKGEQAYRSYAKTTETAYQKVNQKIKENIKQVSDEGKAIQQLETYFKKLSKQTDETFDSKQLKEFEAVLKKVSSDLGGTTDFDLSLEDFDELTKQLTEAKDEFDALNLIVDFFEKKMTSAAGNSGKALDGFEGKIERTKNAISGLETLIKDYDNQIDSIAPGKVQSDLIGERNQATKSLEIQKKLLDDYQKGAKDAKKETLSLSVQLRRVKDDMVKLELEGNRNSEQYNELSDKAEEYRKVLKRTNDELNRSASSTASLDNVIGAVTGLVGIFTVAQGANALFGDENEDLEKALIKVNGAVALLNGLQAIQAELAKKEALSTRGLAFVRTQYAIATNTAATATARFNAALKLSGIGLIISALAAVVVYWDDIKKAINGSTDAYERSVDITKRANDLYGDQISELKLLNDVVKEGKLNTEEQNEAVKKYNETQGKTLGTVKDYKELHEKLVEDGPAYIAYLDKKAKAEAAYQLAVEKTKEAMIQRANTEAGFEDYLTSFFTSAVNKVQGKDTFSLDDAIEKSNEEKAKKLDAQAKAFRDSSSQLNKNAIADQKELGIVIPETNKEIEKSYKSLADTLADLIKRQRDLKTQLIDNDRDREKQVLQDQIEDEKAAYAEKIKNIKLSESEKLRVTQEFNKIYNEETGLAYEQLRKNLQEIDDKYDAEREKVKLNALQAIDAVFLSKEDIDRKAIADRFEKFRQDIFKQIDQTKDEVEKQELASFIFRLDDAEKETTKRFDKDVAEDRLEREREIAKSTLEILKTNNKNIVDLEKLHALELLALDEAFYKEKLNIIKDSVDGIAQQDLLKDLTSQLQNAKFIEDIETIRDKLIEAFGEETAAEIIKTVEALNKVQDEISKTTETSKLESLVTDFAEWTSSIQGFGKKLAEELGFSGERAEAFAEVFAQSINAVFEGLAIGIENEISQSRDRINAIEDQIKTVENSLERERELMDEGRANSYERAQQDLDRLKKQKNEEQATLQAAQKKKVALQKTDFLIDTAAQLSNMITAATKIFDAHASIPFAGVPIATGLIAAMFAAFAVAKVNAFQAIGNTPSYRTGLQKGRVGLSGPSHEEGGFGVHDSRTGRKVAEVENGEDLYVLNPSQQRAYNHLLDMMISDSRGEKDLETSLRNHYDISKKIPKIGQTTIHVIRHVNDLSAKSRKAQGEASEKDDAMYKEIVKIRERMDTEFEGYKQERDNEEKSWETPEYYHVKKGNTTKKYKKK